ncbi:39S ribosomal protein L4, mitochondrial isoform X2 [Manis pentadactyla]|uniref:39S ribosomal protein L4, mitochondrial isoform X2 n=1 Tax=Manis pentadactyla TaxID=143292 RepID=UPI001876AEDC|nr:39S ribosomal protein L4, mitochondrial isoform X2 [Manis pentadactyla]
MLQLVRAGARGWLRRPGCRSLNALAEEAVQPAEKPEPVASAVPQAPVLRRCELPVSPHRRPVQAWIESLRGYEQERVGLAELHPEVFSTAPRAMPRPRLGPRCRVVAGSPGRRKVVGVRDMAASAPRSGEEDDLHIVDSLELPTADPQYLTELAHYRRWGDSVLLVDLAHEDMPQNVVAATSKLKTFTLVPAVGLNVHSMLKHQTLVLTLQTVAFLEEKLLWQDSRYTPLYPFRLPYRDLP